MTKEGPKLLGEIAEEHHVLGNWCPEKKGQYARSEERRVGKEC